MDRILCILSTSILLLLTTSCNDKNTALEADTKISIDLNETTKVFDLSFCFDSSSISRLTVPENEIIGVIKKVIFEDDLIFLLSDKQKQIFIFDIYGNYLRKIDRIGHGPQEYTTISNFFLSDSLIGIVDVHTSNVIFYDRYGNFQRKFTHKDIFRDIIAYENDSYLCFTPDFMPNNPYGIWVMNNDGLFEKYIKKTDEIYTHSINAPWFNISKKDNEDLVYYTSLNRIYSIKNDSIILKYEFDTNRKTLISYPNVKDKRYISDEYYEMIYILDAENWVYSTWVNVKTFEMIKNLYNKKEKKAYSFKDFNMDDSIKETGYPVFSNKTNSLLYITHGDEYQNLNKEEINSLFIHEFEFNRR